MSVLIHFLKKKKKKFPIDTRKSSNQIAHKFQGLAVNVLLFFKGIYCPDTAL